MITEKANEGINKREFIIRKSSLLIILTIILYKFTLEFIYIYGISSRYSYQGLILDFSLEKYILSTFIVLLMSYPMLKLIRKGNTSSIIVLLISLVYFVPGTSLMALANLDSKLFIFHSLYWISLMIWQFFLPNIKANKIKGDPIVFHFIIFSVALFSLLLSGIYTNFRISLDLSSIYDLRFEAREYNIPIYAEYIKNMSTLIMPIGIIYYITNKKKLYTVALLIIQLLNFSFEGKKSQLAIAIVAILVAHFYKKEKTQQVLNALFLINIATLIEIVIRLGNSDLSHYIYRRVLFMPVLIGSYYFEYFNQNELLYLRQSILRYFGFSSPYDYPAQRIIGLMYYGNIETNANTGMIGDAFANFGWIAIIIYPLLIVLAIRVLETCSEGVDYRILALLWILVTYKFLNGSFFTIMLNGGFIFACFTLFVCPRNDNSNLSRNSKGATVKPNTSEQIPI